MDFIYRDFPGKGDIRLYILDNTNLYIQIIGLCENNEDHTMRVNISVKNVDLYDIINTILDKITNDFLYINEYYNKTRFPYNDFIIIDEDEVSNNMACNYDKTKNSYGSSWMEFNKMILCL